MRCFKPVVAAGELQRHRIDRLWWPRADAISPRPAHSSSPRAAAAMCGIIALMLANQYEHCNQALYDGLTVLQHRGQGASRA